MYRIYEADWTMLEEFQDATFATAQAALAFLKPQREAYYDTTLLISREDDAPAIILLQGILYKPHQDLDTPHGALHS